MTDIQATHQTPEPARLPLTVEAYVEAYEHQPIEVVNGEIIQMSPPQLQHVRIAHRTYNSLERFLEQNALGEVYMEAPYLLDADDRTNWVGDARVPDVSFVSQERINAHVEKYGEAGPIRLAPDLAIEVVSPGDTVDEIADKVEDYLRYGVRLVVVLYPRWRTAMLHTPENPQGTQETVILRGDPVLPGWSMPLAELFSAKK